MQKSVKTEYTHLREGKIKESMICSESGICLVSHVWISKYLTKENKNNKHQITGFRALHTIVSFFISFIDRRQIKAIIGLGHLVAHWNDEEIIGFLFCIYTPSGLETVYTLRPNRLNEAYT